MYKPFFSFLRLRQHDCVTKRQKKKKNSSRQKIMYCLQNLYRLHERLQNV